MDCDEDNLELVPGEADPLFEVDAPLVPGDADPVFPWLWARPPPALLVTVTFGM